MPSQVAADTVRVNVDILRRHWTETVCEHTGSIVHMCADARAAVTDPHQLVQLTDMMAAGLTSSPGPGWEWDGARGEWVRWAPFGWSALRCQPSAGPPAGVDLAAAQAPPDATGSWDGAIVDAESSPRLAAFDLATVQAVEAYISAQPVTEVDSRALETPKTHQDEPGCVLLPGWDPETWRLQTPQEWAAAALSDAVWDLAQAQRAWIARPGAGYFKQGSGIGSSRFAGAFWQCLERGPLRNCLEGRWLVFQCSKGHKSVQWTGCTRLDCEHCKEAVGVQRAGRAWDDCGDLAEKWGVCVLTVPPSMRRGIKLEMRAKLRRAAWETTAEWLQGEHKGKPGGKPGDVGGFVWFHPVGSVYVCPRAEHARKMDQPLDALDQCRTVAIKSEAEGQHEKRCSHCAQTLVGVDDEHAHPHWNVLVPLVQQNDDGTASTLEHWYPHQSNSMKRLRKLWALRLALELDLPVPDVVNVYWAYRQGPKHIRHALRYFARSFPGWGRWTTTAGGNRYGTLANKRIADFRAAVSSSIGLVEKPVNVHVCAFKRSGEDACGEESRCQGVTGSMSYRYIADGVIPPDTPHPKAKVEERWAFQ